MFNLLYCFISHKAVLAQDINKWKRVCETHNIKEYLIVCGGSKENIIHDNVLYLDCDDTYEGLSTKTHAIFKFLINKEMKFDYYAKIDRDIDLIKPVDSKILLNGDYCGSWVKIKDGYDGNRKYHFGKCSKNSSWNNKLYPGKFIPWCRGGSGYFLSYKAAQIISCNSPDMNYHIYEDLYVAETLLKNGIAASHIRNLSEYMIDTGDS
jgi:hypothetical protein